VESGNDVGMIEGGGLGFDFEAVEASGSCDQE
jgi:hypothetical protein